MIVGIIVFILLQVLTVVISIMLGDDSALFIRLALKVLIVMVVVTTTVVSVCKLSCRGDNKLNATGKDNSRKASWTVIIISSVFSLFNFIFLAGFFMGLITDHPLIAVLPLIFAIPLNSAVNPIIYLRRRKDMQQFYSGCCC